MTGLRPPQFWIVVTLVLVAALAPVPAREGAAGDEPWKAHIRTMNDALSRSDATSALRAWQDAHLAALGSWRWEGMVEVGDAVLRIADASGHRTAARARARQAYLTAFFRARAQESLDGVLRSAEALAVLGDREAVEQCLVAAERLIALSGDPHARERVRSFVARWATTAWAGEILNAP